MTTTEEPVGGAFIPELEADADCLEAALIYAAAGLYLVPVKRGSKNPGSRVGKGWPTQSSRDREQITAWFAASTDGIALHAGRSGLIIVDMDHPDKAPDGLLEAIRAAHPPMQASRPGRWHCIFRQPPGRRIGNGNGSLGGAWGEIRGTNGVIILAPSVHVDAADGALYVWIRAGEIPVLPDYIADQLADTTEAADSATDVEVAAFLATHTDGDRDDLLNAWSSIVADKFALGSRHDAAVTVLAGMMKEARAGYFPAAPAVDWLREQFVTAATRAPTGGEKQRSVSGARAEFDSILSWAIAQAGAATIEDITARTDGKVPPPRVTFIDGDDAGFRVNPTNLLAHVFDAEDGFWDARESLHMIYEAALSRMCPPWAVLAFCAARALTMVRPVVTLPPIIGGPGSLNWFAALAGRSSGGKGAAASCARDLMNVDVWKCNLGSGEGMLGAFWKPGTRNRPPVVHESTMFEAPEMDTMSALGERSGSTLMGTLRSGFSGEMLGFTYRNNDHHLQAHSYRMTLVLSLQPRRAGGLLGDHAGGTPQRFQWFPADDARIGHDRPLWPGNLDVPAFGAWQYPRELVIPDEATDYIIDARVRNARGEMGALDSHSVFAREKFAFALAVLDNREQMTSEDWRLSGIATEVSARTRDWVRAELALSVDEEAVMAGRQRGVMAAATDEEKAFRADERTARISRWVMEKLTEPTKNRDLARACATRDRPWLAGALDSLVKAGLIERDDEKRWAKR